MKSKPEGPASSIQSEVAVAAVRRLIHPLWAKVAHPAYANRLREFEKSQYLHPEELRKLQLRRLRQQLIEAYRYVPLYRLRMTEAGLTPLDIRTHEDLRLLPPLTKLDIQNHQDLLVSSNVAAGKRKQARTGGYTGSPLQFYVDRECLDSRMALTARHNAWAGLRVGDWHAQLWGSRFKFGGAPNSDPRWRQRFLNRNLILRTDAAAEESMMHYVELLRKYRPRYMVSDAPSAVLFAEFCDTNKFHDIAFESIIVSADVLLPSKREFLEETFRGKVFHRYDCREISIIASECEYHSGLHVNAEALIVEVEGAPNLPAGMGRVLITDLLNRSMPLIRYEIGDLASFDSQMRCPCGRTLPLIGNIQGRTSELMRPPADRRLAGPSLGVLGVDRRNVRQIQFVPPALEHVTLKVVAGTAYSQHPEQGLRRPMQLLLENENSLNMVAAPTPSDVPGQNTFVKVTESTAIRKAVSQ